MISLLLAAIVSSCIGCHKEQAVKLKNDVHATVGLSCHDCHGGNPAEKTNKAVAHDAQSFVGKPPRTDIPSYCGKCHSSADYMKRFNPAARVDQVTEYLTSRHGQRLSAGDVNVATCIDCHSVHDIRRKSDPEGPVYATHVAETCSRCHSDPKRMASYSLPTDQYARWRISVHAAAMFDRNDLSAPTCNDCHGNHGATPPGIESVSFVCGTCHGREAELFRKSVKHTQWAGHNDLLSTGAKCGDCHDDARKNVDITHFGECVTCHENHAVVRPGVAMVGMLPQVPCAFCHEGSGKLAKLVEEPPRKASHYREVRDRLLATAAKSGLKGDERFDWLVDEAQRLSWHLMPASDGGVKPPLRPEFARLFDKFRIGKTHYSFDDPSGKRVKVAVRRCADCHPAEDSPGMTNARALASATHGLTSMIARAERIQLAAHRGGVETRAARVHLDTAVDNQIELESLVHTFGGAEIASKESEGIENARAALVSAQKSLDEMGYRRRGLLAALGAILLALTALALKIRTM